MSKIEKITSDQYIKLVLKGIDPVEFFGKPIVLTDHSEPTKQKGVFPYTEEHNAHQYAQYHTNASSAPTAGENKPVNNPVDSNDSIDAESNPLEELIEDAAHGVADFVHSLFAPFDVENEEELEEDSEENLTDAEGYNSGVVFVNLDKDGISIEFSSGDCDCEDCDCDYCDCDYCDCEDGECELEKEFDRNDYSGYDVDPEKPEHDDEFYEYYSSYRQHPSHGKNAKFNKAEPKSDAKDKISEDFKKDTKAAQLTLLRLSYLLADEARAESAWLLNSIQDFLESEEVSIPLLKEKLEEHKENKRHTLSERLDEGRNIFEDFLNTVAPQPENTNTASTKESTLSTGNTGRHKTYNVHNLHNANSAHSAKTTKEQAPTVEKVLSEDGLDGIFSFFESLGVSSARAEKDKFEEDERNANEAEYLEALRQAKAKAQEQSSQPKPKMKTKNGTPVEFEDDVIDFLKMFF